MSKSRPKDTKPEKPWEGFPLFAHDSGRWAKKVRGKLHYFGRWGSKAGARIEPVADVRKSAEEALDLWEHQRDDLQRGFAPRVSTGGVDTRALVNGFLAAKRQQVDAGEMKQRTWHDYYVAGTRLADALGRTTPVESLRPEDFGRLRAKLATTLGPVALGNEIQRVRTMFRWAHESQMIPAPMVFGPSFKKPTRATIRKARHAKGVRMFEPAEVATLLKYADVHARAWILLGLNCGFGNSDVAELPEAAVDLEAGVIDFPRPKTGIARRCPLWPETVKALKASRAERRQPKDQADAGLYFRTRFGRRLVRAELTEDAEGKPKRYNSDAVALMFGRLLRDTKLHRDGVGFYTLRHTFATIAEQTRDFPAVERVMGHEQGSNVATMYREHIGDDRLRAVVEHVRAWTFPRRQKLGGDVVATIGVDGAASAPRAASRDASLDSRPGRQARHNRR